MRRRSPRRGTLRAAALGAVVASALPAAAEVTGYLARREIAESSGVAASVAQPGLLFTINDSGNEATLYAVDLTGADRGAWRLRGASNDDWEAVALGPCGAAGAPRAAAPAVPRCVYVGDTGDNDARYPTRVIYRVPEPTAVARPRKKRDELRAERLVYAYRDGAQDVEAMYVAPDGATYLVTKRPRRDRRGALRPALVYRLPADAWARRTSAKEPAVAELVDSLPAIVPGSSSFRVVTDAALSADARRLAVRTYAQLWVYATDPRTGRVRRDVAPRVCDLSPLREEQGEGVAWLPATVRAAARAGGEALVLTSEGERAPIHVAACPATGRVRA